MVSRSAVMPTDKKNIVVNDYKIKWTERRLGMWVARKYMSEYAGLMDEQTMLVAWQIADFLTNPQVKNIAKAMRLARGMGWELDKDFEPMHATRCQDDYWIIRTETGAIIPLEVIT